MKSGLIFLTSLLVLGLCSARVTHQRLSQDISIDDRQNQLSPQQTGVKDDSESQNPIIKGEHTLLNTGKEIHDFLVNKVSQLYDLLRGHKNKQELDKALILKPDELPKFQDPLFIGNLYKNYKLAYINFTNVQVYGLSGLNRSEMTVNDKDKSVKLVMNAESLTVTGEYSLSNILKHTSGTFKVKLNKVSYTEEDVYEQNSNDVDISKSQATVRYESAEDDFQNIGFFTQVFEGVITNKLAEDVLPQIGKEVGHLMRTPVLTKLRMAVLGIDNGKLMNGLEEVLKSALSEARNFLKKGSYAEIELDGEPIHIQYNGITGQIVKVHLSGLKTFQVQQLKTDEQNNKIRIEIRATTGPLNGYVNMMVHYQDTRTWIVGYKMNDMDVSMVIEKELYNDNAMFEITEMNVQPKELNADLRESHAEPLLSFFKEQMPLSLKPVINERVSRLVKQSIEDLLNRGKTMTEQTLLKKTDKHPKM